MKTLCKAALIAALTLNCNGAFAADNLRAYMLASACAACHGPTGNSPGNIPSLAGKSKKYIEMSLLDFKSGASEATVMNRLAKGYTDEEIAIIADYYASQEKH